MWTSGLRALSPDDVVVELRVEHPDWAEIDLLRAAQAKSDAQVVAAIRSGQSVMVETVLSTDKFKAVVTEAIEAGFIFGFVFVTVSSADMNEARVRNRAARGGHDVPPDRIRARRTRAHAAASWFAARASIGLVIENSGLAPALLAEKVQDEEHWRVLERSRLEVLGLVL